MTILKNIISANQLTFIQGQITEIKTSNDGSTPRYEWFSDRLKLWGLNTTSPKNYILLNNSIKIKNGQFIEFKIERHDPICPILGIGNSWTTVEGNKLRISIGGQLIDKTAGVSIPANTPITFRYVKIDDYTLDVYRNGVFLLTNIYTIPTSEITFGAINAQRLTTLNSTRTASYYYINVNDEYMINFDEGVGEIIKSTGILINT